MKLQLENIIDKHIGQKCIVAAQGPSLNQYLDKLSSLKDVGYTLISCNSWQEFHPSCSPHYCVLANNVETCKSKLDLVNHHNITLIYADTVDLVDQDWLEKNLKVDFLPYDQRHFDGKECVDCRTRAGCEKYFDPKRLTIQEQLQKYTGFDKHYDCGSTVALHMVAVAILMGFSDIYLTGLDFNYRIGYASNLSNIPVSDLNHFDIYGKGILEDMEIIAKSAEKKGVKIYNLNKNSHWKIFNYIEI